MRKTKEILRLKFEGSLGNHKIGRALGVSASTVWDTHARFQAAGLTWPLPPELSEAELEARLYRRRGDLAANPERVPDWAGVQRELRRKHVTLREGYIYSDSCRNPVILVDQSAEPGNAEHLTSGAGQSWFGFRGLKRQPPMRSFLVVVADVLPEDSLKVAFSEDQDVV